MLWTIDNNCMIKYYNYTILNSVQYIQISGIVFKKVITVTVVRTTVNNPIRK